MHSYHLIQPKCRSRNDERCRQPFPAVSLTLTTIPQAVLGVILNLILPKEKENAKRFYLTSRSRNISVLLLKMDSSLYSQIKPVLIFIR